MVQREDGAVTYTIEQMKAMIEDARNCQRIALLAEELLAETESLTRQLRAEEITGLNVRLRTARECAEIAESRHLSLAAIGAGKKIRAKFGVPA